MNPRIIRHFTVSADLAAPTKATPFVPSAPIIVPLGHKARHGTATTGAWHRHGSLYFERRNGLLFMAASPSGPYKRVPDWALLAVQWIPESAQDIQTSKLLYITEPGRQRNRKATDGEREMVAIVALKNLGKSWSEISVILGIPRRVLEGRRAEIIRVFRDLDQIGNTEKVFLGKCQSFNDGWSGHHDGGHESGKQTGAKIEEEWTQAKVYHVGVESKETLLEKSLDEKEPTSERSFEEALELAKTSPLKPYEKVSSSANSDLNS